MPVQATNTMELLAAINMSLSDIRDKMEKDSKGKGSAGSSKPETNEAISGKGSLGKMFGPAVAAGQALSAIGKGLLDIAKVGKPKRVGEYLEKIGDFVERMEKFSKGFEANAGKNAATAMKDFSSGLAELFKTITLKKLLVLKIAASVLKPKTGEKIGKFYNKLITELKRGVDKADKDFLKDLGKITDGIVKLLKTLVIVVGVMTLIVTLKPMALIGGLAATAVLLGMSIFLFKLISKEFTGKEGKEKKDGVKTFTHAIGALCIAMVVMVAIAAIAKFIPIEGYLLMGVILGLALGSLWLISKMVSKNGKDMLMGVLGFTVLLLTLVLSLSIIRSMVKTKKKLEDTIIGLVILAAIVGMALGIFYILAHTKTQKTLIQAGASLIVIAVVMGILSGIIKLVLIPIGKKWKPALIGLGILAIMVGGLLLMMRALSSKKISGGLVRAKAQALLLAGIVVSLLGLAYTIKIIAETFDTNVGKAALSMTILGLLAVGLYYFAQAVSKLGSKGSKLMVQMAIGAGVITMASAVLVVMSGCVNISMQLLRALDDYGWDKYLKNLGLTLLVISGLGLIMAGIGALSALAIAIAIGGVILTGISAVMMVMSGTVLVTIAMLKGLDDYGGAKKFAKNLLIVEGIIGAYGLILTAMSVLLLPLSFMMPLIIAELATMGVATLGLAGLIVILIGTLKLIESTGWKKEDITNLANAGIEMFFAFLTPLATNIFEFALLFITAGPVIAMLALMMPTLSFILSSTIDVLKQFVDFITNDVKMSLADFKDKENPFILCVTSLANAVVDFFKIVGEGLSSIGFWTALIIGAISEELSPTLDMISNFIDVVEKVATMHVITGYDDNGNPMFRQLPPDVFQRSAKAIGEGFNDFVTGLKRGFDQLTPESVWTMKWMSKQMFPILDMVSKFVDIVIKVSTMTIITGYDENGNPMFEKLPENTFSKTATDIGAGFATFIMFLDEAFNNLSEDAIDAMDDMKKIFKPLMDSVSTFVDATIRLATAQYIEDWEVVESSKGGEKMLKPVYGTIPCVRGGTNWAYDAAVTIAETFGIFIETLGTSMQSMDDDKIDLLKDLSKIIEPILNSVSQYIDATIKVATARYISGYDDNGKPIYEKLEPNWPENAANAIATSFRTFIISLATACNFIKDDAEDGMETLSETIEPIMNSVSSYAEALVKLGQNQFAISGYDEKGNPIYDTSKKVDWGEIGKNVASTYVDFILEFCRMAKRHEEEIEDAEDAVETLGEMLPPIMEMLNKYTTSVEKMLKKVGGDKDKGTEGVEIYTKMAEATRAAIDGIFAIFEGPRSLNMEVIKKWQLDTDEAVSAYQNLARAVAQVQKTANGLKTIYDNFGGSEGEGGEDKSAKMKTIMQNLSDAVIVWGTKDFKNASTTITTHTPVIINSLTSLSKIFKELRSTSKDLSSAITDLGHAMDDVLIEQKDKRIEALNEVKQSFDKVSQSIDKVKSSIQDLAKQDFDTLSANIEKVAESFMKAFEEHNAMNAAANPDEFNEWAESEGGEGMFSGKNKMVKSHFWENFWENMQRIKRGESPEFGTGGNTYNISNESPGGRQIKNITVYFGAKAFHGRVELT